MLAAVTRGVGDMEVLEVPEPPAPGPGEVLVHPDAVGICGSDFHFFAGELQIFEGSPYPRIQGHEFTGTIDQLGPETSGRLSVGDRVSILPISNCGECYPCRVGRGNVCDELQPDRDPHRRRPAGEASRPRVAGLRDRHRSARHRGAGGAILDRRSHRQPGRGRRWGARRRPRCRPDRPGIAPACPRPRGHDAAGRPAPESSRPGGCDRRRGPALGGRRSGRRSLS